MRSRRVNPPSPSVRATRWARQWRSEERGTPQRREAAIQAVYWAEASGRTVSDEMRRDAEDA